MSDFSVSIMFPLYVKCFRYISFGRAKKRISRLYIAFKLFWLSSKRRTIITDNISTFDAYDYVILPDVIFKNLKLSSEAIMTRFYSELEQVFYNNKIKKIKMFLYSDNDPKNISLNEIKPILNQWASIEKIECLDKNDQSGLLLISLIKREEHLALNLMVDNAGDSETCLMDYIDGFLKDNVQPAFIYFDCDRIFSTNNYFSDRRKVLSAMCEHSIGLGISIESSVNKELLEKLELLIKFIRNADFTSPLAISAPLAINSELQQQYYNFLVNNNIDFDGSFIFYNTPIGNQFLGLSLKQNYTKLSCYYPHDFDLRLPSYKPKLDEVKVIPMLHFDAFLEDLNTRDFVFFRNDWYVDPKMLMRYLDYNKLTRNNTHTEKNTYNNQNYSNHLIYNRPYSANSNRLTALFFPLAGKTITGIKKTLCQLKKSLNKSNINQSFKSGDQLLQIFDNCVDRKVELQAALDIQMEEHFYLDDININLPLREDIHYFSDFIPKKIGTTLEIGSGFGQLATFLSNRAENYYCLDLDQRMFHHIKNSPSMYGVVADIQNLPFPNQCFDTIIANNIIEHLYDPLKSLLELKKSLKPSGQIIGLVPLDALNSEFDLPAHLWKIDKQSLHYAFEAAGYAVNKFEIINLYELGVKNSFPTCNGFACQFNISPKVEISTCVA